MFEGPKKVGIREYEERPLQPDEVRLRTLYSGISAGTELTAYSGTNPYLTKRWDAERRLFVDGEVSLQYPIEGWGYEEVGQVVEVGGEATEVAARRRRLRHVGPPQRDVVAASWAAQRSCPPAWTRCSASSPASARSPSTRCTTPTSRSASRRRLRPGRPRPARHPAARLTGATVVAVDGIPAGSSWRSRSAPTTSSTSRARPAEEIKELTGGRGADVSIEISGSYRALHEAIRATAYNSRVVASGFPQGEGDGSRSWARSSTTTGSRGLLADLRGQPGARPPLERPTPRAHRHGPRRRAAIDLTARHAHRSRSPTLTKLSPCSPSRREAVQVVLDFRAVT